MRVNCLSDELTCEIVGCSPVTASWPAGPLTRLATRGVVIKPRDRWPVADDRPAEVFLDAPKVCLLANAARKAAFLALLAARFGYPLDHIRNSLKGRTASLVSKAPTLFQ